MAGDTSSTGDAEWHVLHCDRWTQMDPQSLYNIIKLFLLTLMPTPANVIGVVCMQYKYAKHCLVDFIKIHLIIFKKLCIRFFEMLV